MAQWVSQEWFVKWLELARVPMPGDTENDGATSAGDNQAEASPAFGCAQLDGAEENKLAA
jgi:hypothetical protein